MSPEQMQSAKNVDARTDVWSLGAILYQLLAGRPPYVADSIPQLCSVLLNEAPPPIKNFRRETSDELEAAVLKALEKKRDSRYENIGTFALALIPFAPGSRIHAERAARVLGMAESGEHAPEPAVMAPTTTGSALSDSAPARSIDIGVENTVPSSPPKHVTDRTLASWGKTGDPVQIVTRRRTPMRPFLLLGAGLGAAAALIAWGISRTTATATPAEPSAVAPTPDVPVTAKPVAPEGPTPVPAAAEDPPAPAVVAVDAGVAETAAKRARPAAPAAPRSAAPAHSAAKSGPALPDFGGRR
jgi:serine/threonine-protein kinase